MPDVPRDPRQLARDILSGKIKIEDLARERQMRGGGVPMPARPQVPDKVPLPRTPPPRPPVQPQMPRPLQRAPIPARPQQRTLPQQRPVPQQRPTPVRVPQRQVQRPPMTLPPPAQRQMQPSTAAAAQRRIEPPVQVLGQPAYGTAGAANAEVVAARRLPTILALVRSKRGLLQGILLAEVLGKPVGLRDIP